MSFEGYRPGSAGYRRVTLSLFAAGVATFAELYSTQAVLPELAADFDLSPSGSARSASPPPRWGSGSRCSSWGR